MKRIIIFSLFATVLTMQFSFAKKVKDTTAGTKKDIIKRDGISDHFLLLGI